MLQSQPSPDDTNIANTDQKTTAAIIVPVIENSKSMNIVDQDQQLSTTQKDPLEKAINRASNRGTLIQSILTIPTFAVQLNNSLKYLNECPIQPLINIFLIVHGCATLANGIVIFIGFITANYIKRSRTPSPKARHLLGISLIGQLIFLVFSIAWLIAGQVWVFGAQRNGFQSTNATESATYCHSTVFWTAFAIIIITYAIWLIIIIVVVVQFIKKRQKAKKVATPATGEP